jgi:nucleoside-diphosphate-sugar epimerase
MDILLTGYNGFLGTNILRELLSNGFKVYKVGRADDADVKFDLAANLPKLPPADMVVHCAGKAHSVPKDASESNLFYNINFEGTRRLCEAIEISGFLPNTFVFISTVAVYGLSEGKAISEDHSIIGGTPYADSKIKAEQYLCAWGVKTGINILILRLPLIVGANAPGNLGKMVKGIQNGTYFSIAGGKARKSMVLSSEVAKIICNAKSFKGVYNLTDGYHPSFSELENLISKHFGKGKPFNLPLFFAKGLGLIGDVFRFFPVNTETINKICSELTFSDEKAQNEIGWKPLPILENWIPE